MSLINDALQDLQLRQEHSSVALGDAQTTESSLPNESDLLASTEKPERQWRVSPVWSYLTVAALCVGGGYYLARTEQAPEAIAQTAESPLPPLPGVELALSSDLPTDRRTAGGVTLPANAENSLVNTEVPEARIPRHQETIRNASTLKSNAQTKFNDLGVNKDDENIDEASKKETLALLLELAHQALAQKRLTLPKDRSALSYFQQVLAIDKHNADAKQGLLSLKQQYIALLQQYMDDGAIEKAERMVARLALVGGSEDEQRRLTSSLAEVKQQIMQATFLTARPPVDDTLADDIHVIPASDEPTYVKQQAQASKGAFHFQLTQESQDIATFQKASALIASGDRATAISMLQAYVDQYPASVKCNVLLVETLVAQNDVARAQIQIAALPVNHVALTYLNAVLVNAIHGADQALVLLEGKPPENQIEQSQLALMAGLYQKQKQYDKAWNTYQVLLQKNANDLRYLLGYAVSADALNKKQQAYRAYTSLDALVHPDPAIQKFVQQRLTALKSDVVVEVSQW
ncbi:hypothetical protein TDB9533_02399 [Thalassocella blandensis]|nr:hypothetical protein TDB9533_02399 [Thalassocella blandensis]